MAINTKLFEEAWHEGGLPPTATGRWYIATTKLFAAIENSEALLMLVLKDDQIAELYKEIVTKSNELELRELVKAKLKAFEESLSPEEKAIITGAPFK